MPAQRINGFFYSWSSITIKVDDLEFWEVVGIDYGDTVERGRVRGGSARFEGSTRGTYEPSCEITMLREGWDRLLDALVAKGGGAGYSEVACSIVVSYAERGTGVTTDQIRGVRLVKPASSNAQGSAASTVKIGCDCKEILWGKNKAYAVYENDVDFFSGADGELYARSPYDTVVLAGEMLPGICKVKGLPQLEVDKKKAKGAAGATITIGGYIPGPIEIECMIWTQEQWDEMKRIGRMLWNDQIKAAANAIAAAKTTAEAKTAKAHSYKAVSIYHPWLSLWNVNTVAIVGVGVPEPGPVPQSLVVSIKAIEKTPETKKTVAGTMKLTKATQVKPHRSNPANSAVTPPGSDPQYMTPAGG